MAHHSDSDHESLLRTYVWAGTAIFAVTVVAVVVVLSLHQSDALVKLVLALTPTFASAVGVITTAVLNGRLRDDQRNLRHQVTSIDGKVDTVQTQTNGALSPRIEAVTKKVLQDPVIQKNIASNLADVLVEKAVPRIVDTARTRPETARTRSTDAVQNSPGFPTGDVAQPSTD